MHAYRQKTVKLSQDQTVDPGMMYLKLYKVRARGALPACVARLLVHRPLPACLPA